MKEHLFENPVELRTAASAPRFADRRVAQRAQRVVPLDEIRGKLRMRRFWLLGGAFALALVLGAASALVAVQLKRLTANNQIPQVEEPQITATAADVQPLPVQEESVPQSEVVEEVPTQPVKPIVTAEKRPAPLAQRPRVVGKDRESLSRNGEEVQPSEEEQLRQIREQVLYERWQERRLRRVTRRERRNRNDRDLSHLDEIFEGRRRSERP